MMHSSCGCKYFQPEEPLEKHVLRHIDTQIGLRTDNITTFSALAQLAGLQHSDLFYLMLC